MHTPQYLPSYMKRIMLLSSRTKCMCLVADPACTDVAGQLSDRGALSGRLDSVDRSRPTTPRAVHKCTRTVVSLCPPAAFRRIRTPPPTPLPRLANNLQQRNGHGQGNTPTACCCRCRCRCTTQRAIISGRCRWRSPFESYAGANIRMSHRRAAPRRSVQ